MSATFGKNHQPIFVGVETKQANRRRKTIPPAAELAERIRDTGATVQGLADEFGVSKSKVARDLNDAGYRSNGQPTFQARPMTSEKVETALKSYIARIVPGMWITDAACSPGDDWFPEKGTISHNDTYALQTCRRCPVQLQCLSHAIKNDEREGIWGGLNTAQRDKLADGAA